MSSQFLQTSKEINEWLTHHHISNYTILPDLTVVVSGDVLLNRYSFQALPVQFHEVGGDFNVADTTLTSLRGCPQKVLGDFDCSGCQLTSLEHAPLIVKGNFHCGGNRLTNLRGSPQEVGLGRLGGNFSFLGNQITSLEGCPERVGGGFFGQRNQIQNLEFFPAFIYKMVELSGNPALGDIQFLYTHEEVYAHHLAFKTAKEEKELLLQKIQTPGELPNSNPTVFRHKI